MPDQHEKDHWRELAELLGLPPDKNQPDAAGSPPEVPPQEREREPSHKAWSPPEAEPIAEAAFEPAYHEEDDAAKPPFLEPQEGQPPEYEPSYSETTEAERAEPEMEPAPEAIEEDRPRRGRRRGRRGQRGGSSGREHRTQPEPALRLEDTGDRLDPAGVDDRETTASDAPEQESAVRGRAPSTEPLPHTDTFEEVLETENEELSEPPRDEDDDDEEIDKLTDWNVPSWTELIGSLYRPER
jgi:hypothetical protein